MIYPVDRVIQPLNNRSLYFCFSSSLSIGLPSVCLSVCQSVSLSVCLSMSLSVSLSVSQSVWLSVSQSLFVYEPVSLSVCQPVSLFSYLHVCLSVSQCVFLSVYQPVSLSICLPFLSMLLQVNYSGAPAARRAAKRSPIPI